MSQCALVIMDFVRWNGAHGSPMLSSPESISCFFSSLIVRTVGKHGIDISPPERRLLHLQILGVWTVYELCSSLEVSMPCFVAVSFSTWPAFLCGMDGIFPCHRGPIYFLIRKNSAIATSHVILASFGECDLLRLGAVACSNDKANSFRL